MAAVLFDMDGLLVDTEPVWTVAEEELAAALGGVWSAGLKARIAGTRLDAAVPMILRHYGVTPTPAEVAARKAFLLDRMVALFTAHVPVYPGALELVDGVRAGGVPTALVSSSFRVLMDAVLGRIGRHRFDVTVAGDEVARGKPDPMPYLQACARLGVEPGACVVLEDAPAGVASAEAAGAIVVAVPGVAPIPATPTRRVRAALTDVDPDWLLRLTPPVAG